MDQVLTKNFGVKDSHKLRAYEETGGYSVLKKLFKMKPDGVIEEVKKSALRGRGGAGFPTGMKWSFVPKNTGKPIYLCVNADEGEPGTFKDRYLLELDPHRVIEGIIIAAYAIGCRTAYVYVRGEFDLPARRLEEAIEEAYEEGYLGKDILKSGFDLDVYVHKGFGAYICGEETALIESIEGRRGHPRLKPPFPAVVGLFGCPTVVNNIETISALPYIMENGGSAYKKMGTEKSTGTKLISVSGPVAKPGVYEVELGLPLRTFLYDKEYAGGMRKGKVLKGVIPGGSSVPILTIEDVEKVNIDYESMMEHGTMLGSGGMIVIPEDYCIVRALKILMRFYAHESCGQCSICREGSGWVYKIVSRIEEGGGRPGDIDLLLDVVSQMKGTTICPLSDSVAMPVESYIAKFRDEFEEHIRLKKCPRL